MARGRLVDLSYSEQAHLVELEVDEDWDLGRNDLAIRSRRLASRRAIEEVQEERALYRELDHFTDGRRPRPRSRRKAMRSRDFGL